MRYLSASHSAALSKRRHPLLAAALGLACALLLAPAARAAEVMVFAASSLTNVLQELAPAYEAASGDRLLFNFASSSTLARQIEEGAPADVFFSADEARMDRLEHQGDLLAGTRRSLLSNNLVIVVPAEGGSGVSGPRDLVGRGVRVLALAEPQTVPAGIYARQYLVGLGLWRQVIDKVVPTENVRAALAAVESGSADAAIVYRSDAAVSKRVRVAYEVTTAEGPKISYPVAVLRASRTAEASRKYVEFLASATAAEAFRRALFTVLE